MAEDDVEKHLFARQTEQPVGMIGLDTFERCMEVWSKLKGCHVSDATMRNFWFAMESRRVSWGRAGHEGTLRALGQSLGEQYLGRHWEAVRKDFEDGVLMKSLALHWSILKERLD